MEVTELFSFIKDFGFPVVLSWFLLVRMENKLAGLTDVISELSCNIAEAVNPQIKNQGIKALVFFMLNCG